MRRIAAFALLFSFLFSNVCFSAQNTQQLDKRYWPLQEKYVAALDSGDPDGIITYGTQIYILFVGDNDPAETARRFLSNGDTMEINILSSTLEHVASAYEKKGDYDNAVRYYTILLPFAEAFRETLKNEPYRYADYEFKLTEINNKIKNLNTDITLYLKSAPDFYTNPYTGAKFEPRNGIYYGRAFTGLADHSDKNMLMQNHSKTESAEIIYVQFGEETFEQFDWIFKSAVSDRSVVEVAWNLRQEGRQLSAAINQKDYIIREAKYLGSLNIPVLLRFGAEMNVWEIPADPDEFISAFRLVSTIMKDYAPNVAMLWSPNDVSAMGKNYSMFYPGDDYVDWVGISTYTMKYFGNDRNQDEATQAIYMTGDYANPIERIRPIVEEFGSRKPIILSECGISNYALTYHEDLTGWAAHYLDVLYSYVPMVFPEVKAILYFDKNFENGQETYHYALYDNQELNQKYASLTDNGIFLGLGKPGSDHIYQMIGSQGTDADAANVSITPYFYLPKLNAPSVTYRIDGEWVSQKNAVPYNTVLDFSDLSDGDHELKITLSDGDKILTTKAVLVYKNGSAVQFKDSKKQNTEKISKWAIPYTEDAINKGLVPKTLQDKYKQNINRSEFCALVMNLISKSGKTSIARTAGNPFTDTDSSSILAAYELGIVNGKGEGIFAPFDGITREEAAKMLALASKVLGKDIQAQSASFSDNDSISVWANEYVGYVFHAGIMNGKGDNMFDPKGAYTREEAIKTILSIYDNLSK